MDIAAFAELAVGYQRDFLAAATMTWLGRVPETAPLHRRLVNFPRPLTGKLPGRCDDPAMTRVHARARRTTVPSAKGPSDRCVSAPAAPGTRPTGSQTVSPPPMPRTGTCTATPSLMGALLSTPRIVLGPSSVRCASALSKRRRKYHSLESLLMHSHAFFSFYEDSSCGSGVRLLDRPVCFGISKCRRKGHRLELLLVHCDAFTLRRGSSQGSYAGRPCLGVFPCLSRRRVVGCIRRPISAVDAKQAAVMGHSFMRVSSFLQLSAVTLNVCLWSAASHWRGKSGETTYFPADVFAICVFPSGFQCHRAAMQFLASGGGVWNNA